MSNASGCYLVAKSHQDHRGSQSEQLRTLATLEAELLSPEICTGMWLDRRWHHNSGVARPKIGVGQNLWEGQNV